MTTIDTGLIHSIYFHPPFVSFAVEHGHLTLVEHSRTYVRNGEKTYDQATQKPRTRPSCHEPDATRLDRSDSTAGFLTWSIV
jgi:hypothetical protein